MVGLGIVMLGEEVGGGARDRGEGVGGGARDSDARGSISD